MEPSANVPSQKPQVMTTWKERRKARKSKRAHRSRSLLKHRVLYRYGNKCVRCGNTDVAVLCMDHIENDGADHRRELGFQGASTYIWLKKNNYPSGFQVLCANCNLLKELERRKATLGVDEFDNIEDKKSAVAHYTNGKMCCEDCGNTNIDVLSFIADEELKKQLDENARKKIINWIKVNNFPPGFKVLCMNCNLKRYTIE